MEGRRSARGRGTEGGLLVEDGVGNSTVDLEFR
jgi:hypothetical protein